jgi:hypothetical protein
MAKSNLRAALVATLLAAGLAGCAGDMGPGDPLTPNDVSTARNTPKGLDVGGAPGSPTAGAPRL